jgi:hypothetical protein
MLSSMRLAVGLIVILSGHARAQWGMGMGWGMMGVPESSSTRFLNDHAKARIPSAAARQSRTHSPYAGNSNSYLNRVRDNGFVSHYETRTRRAPSYQPERAASLGNVGRTASRSAPASAKAEAEATRPIIPLKDFFDAAQRLIWPQESPVEGEFREKRDLSDRAGSAVLEQVKAYGSAPVTSVTTAREKLIDYGRPALTHLRATATPPIADGFHRFLLSLYDSLEAAAWPSGSAAAPGSGGTAAPRP